MKKAMQKTEGLNLKFMHANFSLFFSFLLLPLAGWGAPPPVPANRPMQMAQNRPMQGEDIQSTVRQLRTALLDLRNEVKNHDTEIRMFQERLHNQENANEHMRQELSEDFQSQKDFSKATLNSLQNRMENLEIRLSSVEIQLTNLSQASDGVMNDLRQLRSQANESIAVLSQYKQKLTEMDDKMQTQNSHITNLESALQSLMEIFQNKSASSSTQPKNAEGTKTYKVQPGDSLEKIARANRLSIQQLKDYNQLTNDRIIVGQILKLP